MNDVDNYWFTNFILFFIKVIEFLYFPIKETVTESVNMRISGYRA